VFHENAITDGFDFYFGHIGFVFGLKVDFGLWISTQRSIRDEAQRSIVR
jgi:hypothetical protein